LFSLSAARPDLHSFPTRRSSDLATMRLHVAFLRPGLRQPVPGLALAAGLLGLGADEGPHLGRGIALPQRVIAQLVQFAERTQLRSEEHTSELQSRENLVCRLLLE